MILEPVCIRLRAKRQMIKYLRTPFGRKQQVASAKRLPYREPSLWKQKQNMDRLFAKWGMK
jgi:hypothetical protein